MNREAPRALRVVKKFAAGQPGTRKLIEHYGDALVCVRHRHDLNGLYRYTTVELIVEKRPIRGHSDPPIQVRIGFSEKQLQSAVKAAGGRWDPAARLWKLPRSAVIGLGLDARVVARVGSKSMP